jgi:hypothetical protein
MQVGGFFVYRLPVSKKLTGRNKEFLWLITGPQGIPRSGPKTCLTRRYSKRYGVPGRLYRDGSKRRNTTTNSSELYMSRVDPHEAIWSLKFERGEETSAVSLESILDGSTASMAMIRTTVT